MDHIIRSTIGRPRHGCPGLFASQGTLKPMSLIRSASVVCDKRHCLAFAVGVLRAVFIKPTYIKEILKISPHRHDDDRGYFMEAFRIDRLRDATSAKLDFVQENQSFSYKKNTIRGLHFQGHSKPQGKLVRCIQGAILDVAVDIRRGSPTYKKSVVIELSAANDLQLWIPAGFLHGFRTLENNTIVNYKCTEFYDADFEGSVNWKDPELAINWGIEAPSCISKRDRDAISFSKFNSPFEFGVF